MLHKLLLSVALTAGTLGAMALTTSSADAAHPGTVRRQARGQVYHARRAPIRHRHRSHRARHGRIRHSRHHARFSGPRCR